MDKLVNDLKNCILFRGLTSGTIAKLNCKYKLFYN